jgi:hypothetical protein
MLSNNKTIQQAELAGKTKLTAVTIGHGTHRKQFFAMLEHDEQGKAKLPHSTLDRALSGIARGTTITIG